MIIIIRDHKLVSFTITALSIKRQQQISMTLAMKLTKRVTIIMLINMNMNNHIDDYGDDKDNSRVDINTFQE